jgi:hypothetical protein
MGSTAQPTASDQTMDNNNSNNIEQVDAPDK